MTPTTTTPAARTNPITPALALARVVLRILSRDRSAPFFMLALPILIVMVIGAAFGGHPKLRVGYIQGDNSSSARAIVTQLRTTTGLTVTKVASKDAAARALGRGQMDGVLVLPAGLDSTSGAAQRVDLLTASAQNSTALATAVSAAIHRESTTITVYRLLAQQGTTTDLDTVRTKVANADTPVTVRTTSVSSGSTGNDQYTFVTLQEMVLFVFMTCLTTAGLLVRLRATGVLRRMLSTAVSTRSIIVGAGLAWFCLAIVQSVIMVAIGVLLFSAKFGNPASAAVVIVVTAFAGCGAGLAVGVFGGAHDRVEALTPVIGLVLAALGGCMIPLEVFPTFMRTVAKITPHYWALEAWKATALDGKGLAGAAVPLAVLAGFGVVLLTASAARFRRSLMPD